VAPLLRSSLPGEVHAAQDEEDNSGEDDKEKVSEELGALRLLRHFRIVPGTMALPVFGLSFIGK
jgi:hypothetical protein